MKSKVTTGFGDKGFTCLWHKDIISKSSDKIVALGKVDELIAVLGICRSHCREEDRVSIDAELFLIQEALSRICAEMMNIEYQYPVEDIHITDLERRIGIVDKGVKLPNHWIFCGRKMLASYLNLARTVTRECERKIVDLLNKGEVGNELLIVYFNRLSDYLYLQCLNAEQNERD